MASFAAALVMSAAARGAEFRGSLYAASNGPVTITTLVNNAAGFPDLYFGNLMFRGYSSPGNPAGLYSYTLFGAGNLPGHSNALSGIPLPDGSYSPSVPRRMPIVINLSMSTPGAPHPWASVSTKDPTNLTSEWVGAPEYSLNRQIAAVRQVARDAIEIGFSAVGVRVRNFAEHSLRIRVSNVCRG